MSESELVELVIDVAPPTCWPGVGSAGDVAPA